MNQRIKEEALKVRDETIAFRRLLHEYPELSGLEVETSRRIQAEIEKLGLPYETLRGTGLIAKLDTGRPGKHIALRADIDALPIQEEANNLKQAKTVCSQIDGVMHACGHDAHTAMLLGSMKVLNALKDSLSGIIYFCFEEGEEVGTGIDAMIEALAPKQIDVVWGIHVMSSLPSHQISVQAGPRLAGLAKIDFTIHGQSGHGSRPDLAVNPVFVAAMILNNLASVFTNQLSADETVTLGITSIQADTAFNVIASKARVLGSYRYFNTEEGLKALDISRKVFENTAAMANATISYDPTFGVHLYPTINDAHYAKVAEVAMKEILDDNQVVECPPWYASESFHRYLDLYPGVFAFLGIQNESLGSGAAHHNEFFDLDESVLETGIIATVKYVFAVMEETNETE